MSIKTKTVILGLLAVTLLVFVRSCNRDPKPDTSIRLAPDEKTKVVTKGRKVTVVRRMPDGSTKTETHFVPDTFSVVEKNNGDVTVNVKKVGLTAQPGVGMIVVSDGAALSLDVKLAYWNRLGLNVGSGFRLGIKPRDFKDFMASSARPFVAVSYQLPYEKLDNTSLLLGYAPINKSVVAGVRVQF